MESDIYLYKETKTIKSTVREVQGNLKKERKRETERQKGRQRLTKYIY